MLGRLANVFNRLRRDSSPNPESVAEWRAKMLNGLQIACEEVGAVTLPTPWLADPAHCFLRREYKLQNGLIFCLMSGGFDVLKQNLVVPATAWMEGFFVGENVANHQAELERNNVLAELHVKFFHAPTYSAKRVVKVQAKEVARALELIGAIAR